MAAVSAVLGCFGTLPANAHYVQPPGDQEAAPALVQVRTTFAFDVTLHAMHSSAERSYSPRIAGPVGTGAVFNPAGAVVMSRATAFPPSDAAKIEAANTAFSGYHHLRWTPTQLKQRHHLKDNEMNEMLQECYGSGGGHCRVRFAGRAREVVFNTKPARVVSVDGRDAAGPTLTVLHTNSDRSKTPTVGVDAEVAPDASFVAMGYDGKGQLARLPGRLVQGQLDDHLRSALAQTFANNGDGVVLVNPTTKGTILGIATVDGTGRLSFVPAHEPVVASGYIIERGGLDGQIDQALGYFSGKHYTHAVPLLDDVTKVLPDQVLLADLAESNRLKGSPEDKSLTSMPSTSGQMDMSGFWSTRAVVVAVVLAAVLAVGIALLVGMRRRRSVRSVGPEDQDGSESEEWGDDDVDHAPVPPVDVGSERPVESEPLSGGHRHSLDEGAGSSRTPAAGTTLIPAHSEAAASAPYCPQCGVELVTGDRFCYHCGTPAR